MTATNEATKEVAERPKKEKSSNAPVKEGPGGIGKTRWRIWSTSFEIDDRYTPIKAVGQGAYGTVCSARDHLTGKKVAIKKISNCFDHDVDARRTLRECMLLRHLRHENVVGIKELLIPRDSEFKDLYIVQDLMDTDLHQIIRSSQPLSNEHHQCFIHQILRGLKYIHSANVLHRDLKPSNLLLTAACDLKICDFGLARTSTEENMMTEYVVTRWYRAPELLLSCDHYSAAIDVWAVGCILAELLRRKPYFPGKDYMDQLTIIIMQLGMPSNRELTFITNPKARKFISDLGKFPKRPFKLEFPDAHPDALDLLDRMLQFDPRKRISVDDALNHPYIAPLRTPEPTAPSPFHFAMEDNKKLKTQLLRNLVIDEIQCYHPTIDFQRIWAAQAAKDKIDAQLHEEKERSAARLKALQNSELSLFGREDIMQNGQPVLYESQNIPSTDLKI